MRQKPGRGRPACRHLAVSFPAATKIAAYPAAAKICPRILSSPNPPTALSEQRFYNIACYAYGADPGYNGDRLGFDCLPCGRAVTCQYECERMSSSCDRLLEGCLVE